LQYASGCAGNQPCPSSKSAESRCEDCGSNQKNYEANNVEFDEAYNPLFRSLTSAHLGYVLVCHILELDCSYILSNLQFIFQEPRSKFGNKERLIRKTQKSLPSKNEA
jgi:hypothetical protein